MSAARQWDAESGEGLLTVDVLRNLWPTALAPLVSQGILTEATTDPANVNAESWEPLLTLVQGGVDRERNQPSLRHTRTPIVSPSAAMQERQRARLERAHVRGPQYRRS